jgi:integrase/recombinase XerD
MSPDETRRLLAVASSFKARVALSLSYGGGLRASEVVLDKAQRIIRIEQSKGRKDRHIMLSPKMLDLLRQWWKVRPTRWERGCRWRSAGCFPAPLKARFCRLGRGLGAGQRHRMGRQETCEIPHAPTDRTPTTKCLGQS